MNYPFKTPSFLHVSSYSLGASLWSFCEISSRYNIRDLQESTFSPCLFLRMKVPDWPWVLVIWMRASIWRFYEIFIKIQHQELCQVSTFPPSLFVKSWWTCRFLTNLEMVSYDMYQSYFIAVKLSSKSNIRSCVKALPILQVPSWNLWGHVGSWWTWRWCHMTCINDKLLWKFHQNPTLGNLSRLYLSSKSLPGVLEDI